MVSASKLSIKRYVSRSSSLGPRRVSFGGRWVRFVAQHSAIVYYLVLCLLWMASPSLSYKFSEMLETHAVHTYGQFLDENEAKLKKLPPSLAAIEYYAFGAFDSFYAEFQTAALASGGEVCQR